MALSDPELDLLRELLVDDPGDDVWLQVGEELVRRMQWADAESVLMGGLAVHPHTAEGWPLMARASMELGHTGLALSALENVPFDPDDDPESARVRVLALERAGRRREALEAAAIFLEFLGDDVVVTAAVERIEAGPPSATPEATPVSIRDPLVSMARAKKYEAVGRPDRAARVYRRILFHDSGYAAATKALRGLGEGAFGRLLTEDLSVDLGDPHDAPPTLEMPTSTTLMPVESDEEHTEIGTVPELPGVEPVGPVPGAFDDDVQTDPLGRAQDPGAELVKSDPVRRRRRRSLFER